MRLLARLIVNFFRLLFAPLFFYRRARAVPRGAWVHLEIDGAVTDLARARPWWRMGGKGPVTVRGVTRLVDTMLDDAKVKGLLVTLRGLEAGMASATSLRAQLARLRAGGREVVVHLPLGAGTKELYVATAASRIFVAPTTSVSPLGFAVSTRYLKGAFDKAGIKPQVLARGRYKSAGESFVRDSMSEPQREQLGVLLHTFYDELVDAIAEGRHVDEVRARAFIDEAPHRAMDAVRAGLVDGEAYEDEIAEKLGTKDDPATLVPAASYFARRTARLFRPLRVPPHIGVLRVHGPIALSSGGAALPFATDEAVVQLARRARKDPRVRGVLLHIDSPGGSALASDRMHRELAHLAADKPVVACMANVAASGGYYVAAPAHAIVAEPTTITGSIGVVAARFSPAPLLEKLGVVTERLAYGKHAGLLDPMGVLGEDETRALDHEIEGIYDAFVQVVADGRKKSTDDVRAVAEGRVWTGKDALGHGLVDKLGGFDVALATLREKIGAGGEKLEPALLSPSRNVIPPIAALARRQRRVAELLAEVTELFGQVFSVRDLFLATSRERVLAWLDLPLP